MTITQISAILFQGSPLGGVLLFLPVLVIFWFLLVLPQQRQRKKWQQMITDLKPGDRVSTQGGIRGTIISIKDDALYLRVPPDNLRLEVTKASVSTVYRDDQPKAEK